MYVCLVPIRFDEDWQFNDVNESMFHVIWYFPHHEQLNLNYHLLPTQDKTKFQYIFHVAIHVYNG